MPRYRLTYDRDGRVNQCWFDAADRSEARGYWRGFKSAGCGQRVRLYDAKGRLLAGPQEHGLVTTTRPGALALEE